MNKKYDVVIIGSGIGGLAVGSLLSKNKKVLLLEKNKSFGGYCAPFTRQGFRFESAVQAINGLYKGSPIYELLKKAGGMDGVEILRPPKLYRAIFPDHDITVPQSDIGKYEKMLCSLFPKESVGIVELFEVLKSIYLEMRKFYLKNSIAKSPFILKYGRSSLQDLMDKFIKDSKLRAIISQYWMYRGLPPSKLSAITFAYIWYDYTANGSYFPKAGMSPIVCNLVNTIKNNGGAVYHGKEVTKLIVDDNRITEIEIGNNLKCLADTVVSNIDVFRTFEMIANDDVDGIGEFIDKLKKNSLSISACKIYLGLNIDARELGINEYEIFVNPSYDMDSMYRSSVDNKFDEAPYSITAYSNLSDEFCKKGNSVISIGFLSGYDYWRKFNKVEYKNKKEKMADSILSRCEALFPGLQKHITTKITATPLTMQRYTGNSSGSIYGWNKRSLVEEIRFMNPTTPVKNLMLSSHWTKMGGGVGGVLLSSDKVCSLINEKA